MSVVRKIKLRICYESQVRFALQKKPGLDSLKGGPDQFFLTVYTGNNQVRLMIEKCIVHMCETTLRHGRLTWRRWYGTKMRLQSAFEQQKGSGLVFFFGFGAIATYDPKTRKKRVRIYFMKTWHGRFTRQKYLVRTNFFMGPDPFFFVV